MLKDKFFSPTFLFTRLPQERGEAGKGRDNVVFPSLNPLYNFIKKAAKNLPNRFSDQVMAIPQTDLEALHKKILDVVSRIRK